MNRPKRSTRNATNNPTVVEDDKTCVYKCLEMLVWATDATARYEYTVEEIRKVQCGESTRTMAEVLAEKRWSELASQAQKDWPLMTAWKRAREESESEDDEEEEPVKVEPPAKRPRPTPEKSRQAPSSAKKTRATPKKKETRKTPRKNQGSTSTEDNDDNQKFEEFAPDLTVPNLEKEMPGNVENFEKDDTDGDKELPPVLEKQVENQAIFSDTQDSDVNEEKPQLEEQIIDEEERTMNRVVEERKKKTLLKKAGQQKRQIPSMEDIPELEKVDYFEGLEYLTEQPKIELKPEIPKISEEDERNEGVNEIIASLLDAVVKITNE